MDVFRGLGRALLFLRQEQRKSQKQVANDAGVTPPMLSAYENDRTDPELETLDKILHRGLGVTLPDLCRALEIVNQAPARPGPIAATARREAPPPAARWQGPGRMPNPLREAYDDILRGVLRISHYVYELEGGPPPADRGEEG